MVLLTAVKEPVVQSQTVRRFQLPDLDRHGRWLIKRLLRAYPHLNERGLIGWLRGLMFSSEHMFLCMEKGVALAQVQRDVTLAPVPVIRERFVYIENPENVEQAERAGEFYEWFGRWAKSMGADTVIVKEMTDVPDDVIKKALGGRLLTRSETFAKV